MHAAATQPAFLASLFDALPQSVTWSAPCFDATGKITDFVIRYANESGGIHIGITRAALIGLRIFSEIDLAEDLRERLWNQYMQVYCNGQRVEDTYFDPLRNKYLHVVRTRADEGILTLATDVTGQQQALQELRRQTQQLQCEQNAARLNSILNSVHTWMLVVTPVLETGGRVVDGIVRLANKAYTDFKNLPLEDITGRSARSLFPPQHHERIFLHYQQALQSGVPARFDLVCDDPGRIYWMDVVVTRLDEDLLVTITNFTKLRQLQLQLEQKVQELQRSNRNLEEFAYAASHDLKEPIRKVRFFIDRLRQHYGPEAGTVPERDFSRLDVATERMRDLVDDLLAYAQVSLRPHHLEPVPLGEVLRNVLVDLEVEIEQVQARISLSPLPVVSGNRRQLQQLFQNLLANALKYHRTGIRPDIRIEASEVWGYETSAFLGPEEAERRYYQVRVTDNGIGFEQSDAEKIFQVFQRLHGNSEFRGTGVGLSIARKVAENHQGFIYAEGRPGEGSTFCVGLPAGTNQDLASGVTPTKS